MRVAQNIFEIPYGYRVIINRTGVRYQVFIKFGDDKPAALARAIAERDNFFAEHGEFGTSGQRPRSNTGISGISEVTKWFHNKPAECFSVTAGHPRHGITRFFYRGSKQRSVALRRAIAHRARLAGEDAAQLLAQAKEALCL